MDEREMVKYVERIADEVARPSLIEIDADFKRVYGRTDMTHTEAAVATAELERRGINACVLALSRIRRT